MKRLCLMLTFITLFGVLSCSDSDSVAPAKGDATVAPPPRTISVRAKLQNYLLTQTANVYVKVNGGAWTLINSVSGINCTDIGSFSASDGDDIRIKVVDSAAPSSTADFRCDATTTCPTSGSYFCGNDGIVYLVTLTSSINTFSLSVNVSSALLVLCN